MPNIKYNTYKEVEHFTVHRQRPLSVKSWCDLCHKMVNDEEMRTFKNKRDGVDEHHHLKKHDEHY